MTDANKGKGAEGADPVKTLKAALTERLHIDHATNPITCAVEDGAMVIEGLVDDIAQKKRALLIAMGLEGISGVVDRLKVRPAREMTDEEIHQHVTDAISWENTLAATGISVEVNDGVVDLEGTVGSLTHKRLAGVFAWWVPGVMDVINSLEVAPPEEDSDDEVTDAVRTILEKDRIVDAGNISVSTRDWVVTLSGAAGSEEARGAAGADAWYVWGVNEVVNDIIV
ncbi:MAG: BON domain-containing protein [Thermodesulfobacteriota bacterium]